MRSRRDERETLEIAQPVEICQLGVPALLLLDLRRINLPSQMTCDRSLKMKKKKDLVAEYLHYRAGRILQEKRP
jgi:hypothetical protein